MNLGEFCFFFFSQIIRPCPSTINSVLPLMRQQITGCVCLPVEVLNLVFVCQSLILSGPWTWSTCTWVSSCFPSTPPVTQSSTNENLVSKVVPPNWGPKWGHCPEPDGAVCQFPRHDRKPSHIMWRLGVCSHVPEWPGPGAVHIQGLKPGSSCL